MRATNEKLCDRNLIPAYIDGELDSASHALFSHHLEACASCRRGLLDHQQFICQLDAAFTDDVEIPVPKNFSRVVAARAVSDMSGVRSGSENKKALAICLVLGLAGFALVGATTRTITLHTAQRLLAKIFGVVSLAWNALYDSIASVAVISRVLSRKFIIETGSLRLFLVLLAAAVLLLSRLISSYHRTGTTE